VTEDILRQEPRLSCLHDGVTTHTAVPSWMEQSLSWQYPYHKAVLTPAKFSVSEIKRQYGLLQTEELSEENSLAVSAQPGHDEEEPFHQLPPWLAEETVTSGARRGTVFHKVMQYVPLRTDLTVQEVNSQLVQWEADGLFSAEEISWVDIPAVISFCQSTLGRRMAQSTDVRREYPFSVLFTGGNYLPDIESGEQILLQGVVDCLFREDDEWVLVDYKTDRLDTEEAFSKRYAIQLSLYKRAVEQISHIKIKDVYIYSFYLHAAIPLK
jgi:ATP-dependent helicase/nuclease subunit A